MIAAATGPWRDLRLRLGTALVAGPLVLGCIWLGGVWFDALIALAVVGLSWEWVRMCGADWRAPALAVLAATALAAFGFPGLGLALLLPAGALAWTSPHRRFVASGILYLGLAGVALVALRQDPAGRANLIFLIFIVWASDSAAYVVGRAVGGAKLWPAVSPGKTWSGAVGGLAGAMVVGAMASAFAPGSWAHGALLGGVLGVLAQAGDLLESGIKRRFDVKDSSQLLPGHGGLLDRLDGLLAAAPAAAGWGWFLGSGEVLWR